MDSKKTIINKIYLDEDTLIIVFLPIYREGVVFTDLLQIISMKPANVEELLEQDFVKNPSKKIKDLLKELIAKTGENMVIKRFVVYVVGEE